MAPKPAANAVKKRGGFCRDISSKLARHLSQQINRVEDKVLKVMAVMDKTTGKMLKYRQLITHPDPEVQKAWLCSAANEYGRLAQGVSGRVKGTDKIQFIRKDKVPANRQKDVMYGMFQCNKRPEKKERNRSRFVAGGNLLKGTYPGDTGTPTTEMLVAKILFNSVVSTRKAKFMTMDASPTSTSIPQ